MIKKEKANKVGQLSQRTMNMLVELVAQNGDRFGNDIIEMMDLKDVNPVSLGAITVGLAKAVAMVKDLGKRTHIDVETLYRQELASYRRQFEVLNKKKGGK